MQFTLDKKNETFATLTISVIETDYKELVDKKAKDYAKTASIKGFRPGKVPVGMVKNMMGEQLTVETISSILSENLQKYVKENDLALVGEPLPSATDTVYDWKNQSEFDFTYDLGLIPSFALDTKLSLVEYDIQVDDKFLETTLEGLKRQFGEVENPEEVSVNDFIKGEFKQDETEISSSVSFSVSDLLAKDNKKVIGSKKDDVIELDLSKAFKASVELNEITSLSPEDLEKIANNGTVKLTITEIINTEKVELNEEFFKKIFPTEEVATLEEFSEKVRVILADNFKKDNDFLLFKSSQNQLLENTQLDFSTDFFKRWLVEINKDLTAEKVDENFDNYTRELKWTLLRNKIAEANEIKVAQEEVKVKATEILSQQYFGGAPIQEEMKEMFDNFTEKYLQENEGRNYMNIFDEVLTQKVFAFIKSDSKISSKKVSIDQFKKIAEEA